MFRPSLILHSRAARTAHRALVAVIVAAVALSAGVVAAPAATAAAAAALIVTKVVDGVETAEHAPGEEFSYTITVGCDDADCVDAELTDELPDAFAGFQILDTRVLPATRPAALVREGCDDVVTDACVIHVSFQDALDGGGVGIRAGQTYQVSITLKVPQDLGPTWPHNGTSIVNTAVATAATADTASDTAAVVVAIDRVADVEVSKTWEPASQQFQPGVVSTVGLGVRNASNVDAESLTLQDPAAADDGAVSLPDSSPFRIVDFVSFGAVSAPQGATQVAVDAYVYNAGSWTWVTGAPAAVTSISLPDGVAADHVAGLRFTFAGADGAVIAADGAAGTVTLQVAQRETDRATDAPLVLGASATNEVAATVRVPGLDPVTETATAPYQIGGLDAKVEAVKSITPARIPAGTSAEARLGAKNASNGPLSSLVLRDTDYFTNDLRFGGFTAPLAYPAGATAAQVTWAFSDGSTSVVEFAAGETPAAPTAPDGAHLTGFTLAYQGAIAPGAVVEAPFRIDTTTSLVPSEDRSPLEAPNTVQVEGINPAGTAEAEATAPLRVFHPDISLELEKRISPAGAITAGGAVVVQLPTKTSTDSAYVVPTRIEIEDVWREDVADDFWNAFTPTALAPTQVLSGSTLTVEALTASGWQTLTVFAASDETRVVSGDFRELAPGVDLSQVTGLRYTFEKADGFAAGTTATPNTVFQARGTLRDSGEPTAVPGEPRVAYENLAAASGAGMVEGGQQVLSDEVTDVADAHIIAYDGEGTVFADKTWNPGSVPSQSGASASSRLSWGITSTGYESVAVADPAGNEASPEQTVFQAFDLTQIRPIEDARWRWDAVQSVELFMDGAWQVVPAPAGGWVNGTRFVGHTLTAQQSAAATGVRITVVPNDAARAASSDALRPQPGSGVTPSADGDWRGFDLSWRLRNTVRVPGEGDPWATGTRQYNDDEPGTIWNTMRVTGVRDGDHVREDRASVVLIDHEPAVKVTKTADRSVVPIPVEGEVPQDGYPRVTYTVVAENDSSARASYIRVTDPMACTDATVRDCVLPADGWSGDPFEGALYDPADNPFERVDLIRVSFELQNGSGVDPRASLVTLWTRAADGTLSTDTVPLAEASGLDAAALSDVVGVSVLYQGTDPATSGGAIAAGADLTMKLETRLRVTERSEGETPVAPVVVANAAFAQVWDPVLYPDLTPHDTAHDDVELVDGVLDVTAAKTISPASLLEKDRALPVKVALEATDGDATVASQQVVVEDADTEFWGSFDLVSVDGVRLPEGADRVRVDVRRGGDWVAGVAGATAVLPDVPLEEIDGVRFFFDRADGGVFSRTAPPQGWSAHVDLTVQLRDTVRGSDEQIVFPRTIGNDILTRSSRSDADLYPAAEATASDDIALLTGTYALDVAKTPLDNRHTVEAAQTVPWTLTFTNTGSGYLTVEHLVDTLPESLEPDFSEDPAYSRSEGGRLSLEPTYTYDPATRTIAFEWPDGGARMSPGESYSITLGIVLQPGLGQAERATNRFVVNTAQPLSACTNTSGNGQGVLPGIPADECGTTNFVEPIPGASLATSKGVKGEVDGELVDGAVNTVNPTGPCLTDDEGYYRAPCAANTVVGATDAWKLSAVNSGTEPYTSLVLAEPLPTPGDVMLATGSPRGSTFRPIFDGGSGLQIEAPEGTTFSWQVTTGDDVCVGSDGRAWRDDPTCSADVWVPADAFTGEWSEVTGLRVVLEFATTAAGVLAPGGSVTVRYQTVNSPATDGDSDLAPVDAPVIDEFAWNQFGAHAVLQSGATLERAPVKAGVTLTAGSLEVTKVIEGDAAGYAPDEFLVDVSCTVAGAVVNLGDQATQRLTAPDGLTARVTGIPLGADCTVDEQGDVGAYGETSRVGVPADFRILYPGAEAHETQRVTVTNLYDFGSLSIEKAVDTAATVGAFGPFDFELACTTAAGRAVQLPDADRAFALQAGDIHVVTAGTIPVGSVCDVAEVGSDEAASVVISGEGVEDAGDGTARVSVGADSRALVTNAYDAGTLSVLKTVTGDGAADYGDGPFAVRVMCTYDDQTVFSQDELPVTPDVPALVDAVFPAGTVCEVSETRTGGATAHTDPPAVTIMGPQGDELVGSVTALVANDFRTGELAIEKRREGDGVAEFGAGPFTARVACTWEKDGQMLAVPLPDGGVVTLDEAGDYRAAVAGIIVGAECVVEETDAGLATTVTMAPADGTVTISEPVEGEQLATVVIVNRFDVGQLEVEKVAESREIRVGETVTYVVSVRNTGQIPATDAVVTDRLPDGATLVGTEGRVDGRTVVWTVDEIPAGGTVSLEVAVRYDEAGDYVNSATVQNPAGPWRPVDAIGDCDGDPEYSCAPVTVTAPPEPTPGPTDPAPEPEPTPGPTDPAPEPTPAPTDPGAEPTPAPVPSPGGTAGPIVAVPEPTPGATAPNAPASPDASGEGHGGLAATGNAGTPLALGALLLVLGAVLLLARRHREGSR
jgi:uncharacterized repeat protein (TIGR01451 family)